MKLIEIEWKGPYSLEETAHLTEKSDFGLYQIYGTHNILGMDTLLYVGQAWNQTFAQRIPQREYATWDFPEYRFYIGRLGGSEPITKELLSDYIDWAEQILIDYCQPPYNSQHLNGLSASIPNDIILLNFSKRHKLPYSITTAWRESSHFTGKWSPYPKGS